MASPVARVRRVDRPATVERSRTTTRPRATSLTETSPFTRTAGEGSEDVVAPSMFGSYVVYEKLGEGGMAYVHRAELVSNTGLRKQVALKRLLTESSEDPSLVSSFVHEAQLAAKLQHPNIAQAYELGRIDNTYYIAMEFVPGPTLGQVIAQARNGAGAVPLAIALEILIQIADALDHVHDLRDEAGKPLDLIHRDISPGNIIISRTGAAKLIDFGIAKVRSGRAQTEAGFIKGKQGYIAPEYTYGQLDHRADLFGLGIVAHELLTARRLFHGNGELETLANVRFMQVPPPSRYAPGISPQLDAIVLKALERDPDKRWQSAGEIRIALVEEARRLGLTISGPQIRDWVEWAFQQVPRRLSTRVLNSLESSLSIEISVEGDSSSRLSETVIVDPPDVQTLLAPQVASLASAQEDTALEDTALRDTALADTALEDTALLDTALRDAALRDAALADTAPQNDAREASTSEPDPLPPAPVAAPRKRRAPSWRAPTRWAYATTEPSTVSRVMMLLIVLASGLFAADQRWIDVEAWRRLLGA
jgi:serine/threonine protein kinase